MINTNDIIDTIKGDIQKTIDHEQSKLNSITAAYENAMQFLLDNGYSEINESDDVLIEVMKCIKTMKNQVKDNKSDIKNINESIKSLTALSNSIDVKIINSLKEKIKGIEEDNDTSSNKLKDSKQFLETLLSLEIVCPVCEGKGGNSSNRKNGVCSCCDDVGVINISKLLEKENLLEVDYVKPITTNSNMNNRFNYDNMYVPSYNNIDYTNQNSSKFSISQN